MTRKIACLVALLSGIAAPTWAAPAGPGEPVQMSCSGPSVETGRKLAAKAGFAVGSEPDACFGRMSMYGGSDKNLVVSAASPACAKGRRLDIYQQARSGTWGSILAKPLCATTVVVGPKDPWGALMITIDGRHYDQRGAFYEPVSY